ncbi:hypothetical protein [Ferrimicrobium sp.]|uniref:hypothetical protein n=1 Tax=Ferrimicrobium sp. TaxID=2926050 RepID=UPI0026211AE2|nr:hypothetical protein [Ferrimicrobium sp.]
MARAADHKGLAPLLGHERPEVAKLALLASLCTGADPAKLAEPIGERGASALEAVVIEAVNERLRPHHRRRAELAADPGYLDEVLARGNARANEVAGETLERVRAAMAMTYLCRRQPIPMWRCAHQRPQHFR